MKVYSNKEFPKKSPDEENHSVDVITRDKDNMLNIGYYSFDEEEWNFHTNTLVDYYPNGKLRDFVWMYAPKKLTTK